MKTIILIANFVAIAALSWAWYVGELVPAWVALIWCLSTTYHDAEAWWKSR